MVSLISKHLTREFISLLFAGITNYVVPKFQNHFDGKDLSVILKHINPYRRTICIKYKLHQLSVIKRLKWYKRAIP